MLILIFSIISIATGYYLLWVTPDLTYEEVVKRAIAGIALTCLGGTLTMIYLYRRSK